MYIQKMESRFLGHFIGRILRSQVVSLPLQSANFCAAMDTLIDQDALKLYKEWLKVNCIALLFLILTQCVRYAMPFMDLSLKTKNNLTNQSIDKKTSPTRSCSKDRQS